MTARERYSVFLKALGIWTVIAGLRILPAATSGFHKYNDSHEFFYMIMDTVAGPAIMVLAGYWLLFSTDWFLRVTGSQLIRGTASQPESVAPSSAREDLFAMILKIIAIWDLVFGVSGIPDAISRLHGARFTTPVFNVWMTGPAVYAVFALCGFLLLFWTEFFVRAAFGRSGSPAHISAEMTSNCGELLLVLAKAIAVWLVIDGIVRLAPLIGRLSQYSLKLFSIGVLLETLAEPIIPLGIGLWLFFGTNWFVRLAFSERDSLADDEEHEAAQP